MADKTKTVSALALKKRKKNSGITGLEMELACTTIKNVITALEQAVVNVDEDEDEDDTAPEPPSEDEIASLKNVLDMLQTKLYGSRVYSFSGMSPDRLKNFGIYSSGRILMKSDCESRAAKNDLIGEHEHWSAKGLVRHLSMLGRLVPRSNEAATRLWINPFFFRVDAMTPQNSRLVLSVEQSVQPIAESTKSFNFLSGFVDFTAIATTENDADIFLQEPILSRLPAQNSALFVSEAKGPDQVLSSHIPQAISEMYACAKHLGKMVIRGVLTNGHMWIFLVLHFNENGIGGKYFLSREIRLLQDDLVQGQMVSQAAASVISGILLHWIQHSHEMIGEDDYFYVS